MDLPTFHFDEMTIEDRQVLLKSFDKPIVIRGLYKPKAFHMKKDDITKLFGNCKLSMEMYQNRDSLEINQGEMTMKELFDYWKTNKKPHIYCADNNLFEREISPDVIEMLKNPNTRSRNEDALVLYLGNEFGSGLHLHVHDDYILNQLYGSKTVYIFSNYDNPNIHKHSSFNFDNFNYAKEDFFKLDHTKMKIYKVTLNAGDSLLIPPWYWHATKGHGINMSITQIYIRNDITYLLKNPNLIIDYLIYNPNKILFLILLLFIVWILLRFRVVSYDSRGA